ncbi:MAG TPA: sigma factor [Candidatus Polarisedimenticolia bacterium]|nr:sigma factor [Candidatus Polarisedimenticolia bacterium]
MERPYRSALQKLMERLAEGDRAALPPAFELLWPLLRRFTGRHLPSGDADDAAQEALLKIFFRAGEFDVSRSALAWVLGVAAFEIRTARRRRARRREDPPPATGSPVPRDLNATPEETAIQQDMEAMLREALGSLRPEDAETLRLYARGDRAAIAAATFRKRVQRSLVRLRAVWKVKHG